MPSRRSVAVPILAALIALVGCKSSEVEVIGQGPSMGADYGRRALLDAVSEAAATPKSAAAYRRFADRVDELRDGFDAAVAKEAELRLLFLAYPPMAARETVSPGKRVHELATTVWPTLFDVKPTAGENVRAYLMRVCQNELARECKDVVPEAWDTVLRAVAWQRLHERARTAYSACAACQQEPAYAKTLASMSKVHADSGARRELAKSRVRPSAWPTAVTHARGLPEAPLFRVLSSGAAELDGIRVGKRKWVEVLRGARVQGPVLAVHLRPRDRISRLRAVMKDARAAGFVEVALVARHPEYPYELSAYHIALGGRKGPKVRARNSDTIQVLVQGLDHASAELPEPVLRLW